MTEDQERGGATAGLGQSVSEWERKADEWRRQCHSVQLQLAVVEDRWKISEVLKSQLQADLAVAAAQLAERDAQIARLTSERDNWAEGCGVDHIRRIAGLQAENEAMRGVVEKGKQLVEEMDQRMPEQATEDADGWIISYRIPVGPWHRLLGWARGGLIVALDQAQQQQEAKGD